MLRAPPNGDPYLTEIVAVLNAELARLEPRIVGCKHDGVNLHIRFIAALDSPWVQVHVQQTGTGGSTYTPGTSVSSTEVDCRAERLQNVMIADVPYERTYAFLVPVQYDGAGAKVLYNGVGGVPDKMSFIDIGV